MHNFTILVCRSVLFASNLESSLKTPNYLAFSEGGRLLGVRLRALYCPKSERWLMIQEHIINPCFLLESFGLSGSKCVKCFLPDYFSCFIPQIVKNFPAPLPSVLLLTILPKFFLPLLQAIASSNIIF